MRKSTTTRLRGALLVCLFLVSVFWIQVAAAKRLTTDIRPTFQQIELRLDPEERAYTGRAQIELAALQPVSSFSFYAEGLTIESLVLSNASGPLKAAHVQADSVLIMVTPDRPLAPGDYTLAIEFHNIFDTQAVSLYRVETEGHGYVFSQMEEDEAREAFPCWDEPGFKFPYQVVLTVPENQMAISNTPVESESRQDGWKRVVFARSRPLPSYLLAFAVGPFDAVPVPGTSIPTRVITVKGKGHLAAEAVKSTPPILAALERYFDAPYPYEKLDLIAAPEFWPGAMENPGAIVYADGVLLPDPATLTVSQRRRLAATTAHEIAHMWFGDLVTMAWWDDLWLNESFATWMGNKIVQEVYPEYGSDVSSVQRMQEVLAGDARPSAKAVRQPVDETSDLLGNIGVVYQKGQAVLGMFEQWMGEETFRAGVLAYLKQHAWGNATAADLWSALAGASGRDVGAAMSTFIDQPGAPLVEVTPHEDGTITIGQRRFSNYGAEPEPSSLWHIPMVLSYAAGGEIRHEAFELKSESATVDLGTDGPPLWIFPHADARGYYRWIAPPEVLRVLAQQSTEVMSPRERVGFLGNLSALLDAGAVSGDVYLDVIHLFGKDPDPQVVTAVLSALGKVENAFVADSLKEPFGRYIRSTLGPALDSYGLEAAAGENESVTTARPRLIGWLADEGRDARALSYAESVFARYMLDPKSADPDLIGVAVGLACRKGDRPLFDECRRRFENARAPAERSRFLLALGSFEDPQLQEEALGYTLNGPIRPQEVFDIPGTIADHSDRHAEQIFQWMMTNYAAIVGRMPPLYKSFMPYFASGCSHERLEAARLFFAAREHQAPGLDVQMARISDQVRDCTTLRDREGARVAAYLTRFETDAR